MKLSVAVATFNEEKNIGECLKSVVDLADEIVIVDGTSQDKTVEIAKNFGAKIEVRDNPPIFHINKQRALDLSSGEWILQLDADERVSPELAEEIRKIISMTDKEIEKYQDKLKSRELFLAHQQLLKERDEKVGSQTGEFAGFFVPRLNFFLGRFLRYGGAYPDGVIRLVKKGKASFPCQSVHEQIEIDGKVGWLQNDLLHLADPTLSRYFQRNNRYIDLMVQEFKKNNLSKNLVQFLNYILIKPIYWFYLTGISHKGILDGLQGIIFSFFSALRFPKAYLKYLLSK